MSAKFYIEYLEKSGMESWDSRVIHTLLERQYQVSKLAVDKIVAASASEDVNKELDALLVQRKSALDATTRLALAQVNAAPLPEIRGGNELDSANVLRTVLPASSASSSVIAGAKPAALSVIPAAQLITEDVGPSEATHFAAQKRSVELQLDSEPKRVKLAAQE